MSKGGKLLIQPDINFRSNSSEEVCVSWVKMMQYVEVLAF